nr:MAG TPA: hypothetical protein [Caudoviricetes sp.]
MCRLPESCIEGHQVLSSFLMRKVQHGVTHCQEGNGDIHDCITRMQIDHAGRQYIERRVVS